MICEYRRARVTRRRSPRAISSAPGMVPLGTRASDTTMKIIATRTGTPRTVVTNVASCPRWEVFSPLASASETPAPTTPATSARTVPTGRPSSRRAAQPRPSTSSRALTSRATLPSALRWTCAELAATVAPPGAYGLVTDVSDHTEKRGQAARPAVSPGRRR